MKKNKHTCLGAFNQPDAKCQMNLEMLIQELPISNHKASYGGRSRTEGNVTIKGDLNAIMLELMPCLKRDYDENISDSSKYGYQFDYYIEMGLIYKKALSIMTRIYDSEGKMGSISYGRSVVRIGKNLYLLWTDE